jgi:RNA-binding protein YhbY
MPLTAQLRRALAARGNRLPDKLTLGAEPPTLATLDHVRRAFVRDDLIKVRINTDDRGAFGRTVDALAAGVPCEVVQRVGRVALLYRERPAAD